MGAVAPTSGTGFVKVDPAEAQRKAEAARQKAEAARLAAEAKRKAAAKARDSVVQAQRDANVARQQKAAANTVATDARKASRKPGQTPEESKKSKEHVDTAETKRQEATQKSKGADKRLQDKEEKAALSAKSAEEAMRKANAAAVAECKPPPYSQKDLDATRPTRNEFESAFEGTNRKAELEKVLGLTPPPAVATRPGASPEEAAKEDAKKVGKALLPHRIDPKNPLGSVMNFPLKTQPDAAARELGELLKNGESPEYRKALLEAVKPELQHLGGALEDTGSLGKETVTALGKTASTLRPEEQRLLAEGLAAGVGADARLGTGTHEGLRENIQKGEGAALSVHLATALERSGKSRPAEALTQTAREEVKAIREDFAEKSQKVEELNGQVARLVAGFGPALTEKEKTNAINAFKDRHQEEYGALEDSAKQLKGAVEVSNEVLGQKGSTLFAGKNGGLPGLEQEAVAAMKQLEGFVGTDTGQKFIDEEVEKQGKGEPSFLDGVAELVAGTKLGKDANDIAKGLTTAVSKGLVSAALQEAANGGGTAAARRVFDNVLSKNPTLFGVTAGDVNILKGHFNDLMDGTLGADKALNAAIERLVVDVPGTTGSSSAAAALRGLGVVAGLFAVTNSGTEIAKKLKDDKGLALADATKLLGDALSAKADTGLFLLDVFKKDAPTAHAVFGKLNPVGGVLGAIGDGLAAANAFQEGELLEGFAKSASAAGGALLAAAALSQAVPVAGQVVGGILFAAGTGLSLWNDSQKRQEKQEDTRAFLKGAGISSHLSKWLGDPDTAVQTGRFLDQLAVQLHTTPYELRKQLESVEDPKKLDAFFYAVKKTPSDDSERFVIQDATPGQFRTQGFSAGGHGAGQVYSVSEYYLESLADAAAYLRSNGIFA